MTGDEPIGSPAWHRTLEVAMSRPGQAGPQALAAVEALARKLARDVADARCTHSAQTAMVWTCQGHHAHVRDLLAILPAGQVRNISAAAALLASTADEVLTQTKT